MFSSLSNKTSQAELEVAIFQFVAFLCIEAVLLLGKRKMTSGFFESH
jgi:hypothetical protein